MYDKKIFAANLSRCMQSHHETQVDVAKLLNISKSNVSAYLNGNQIPRMDKVQKLVDHYGISVSELLGDSSDNASDALIKHDHMIRYDKLADQEKFYIDSLIDLSVSHPDRAQTVLYDAVLAFGDSNWSPENKENPGLSTEASRLASDFDDMDKWGRKAVRSLADTELARISEVEGSADNIVQIRPAVKDIPLLGTSFAAGTGEIDTGNAWSLYTVPASSPAEFAIRINGDSMEPWLPDGSVALCRRENPRDGEVAALLIDGEFLCKQVCQDITGALHLFSLNRARKDADRDIPRDDIDRQVVCFGTVILDKVPPLPID